MATAKEIRSALEAWRSGVMRNPGIPARAKVVAFVISAHVDVEAAEINNSLLTGNIFPGLDRIAAEGGFSRRTAAQGIAELQKSAALSWKRRSHNSNLYTLHLCPNVQTAARHEMQAVAHQNGNEVQTPALRDVQDGAAQCADVRPVTCEDSHRILGRYPNDLGDVQTLACDELDRALDRLRTKVGNKNWNPQPFEGAEFLAPDIIAVASKDHLKIANKRYAAVLKELGYRTRERCVA